MISEEQKKIFELYDERKTALAIARFEESFAPFGANIKNFETPLMLTERVMHYMLGVGDFILSYVGQPGFIHSHKNKVPEPLHGDLRSEKRPRFMTLDFLLTQDGPRLVEVQGFPSDTPSIAKLAEAYAEEYNICNPHFLAGVSFESFDDFFNAFYGSEDMLLIDLNLSGQKTSYDFEVIRKLTGGRVAVADAAEVSVKGSAMAFNGRRFSTVINRMLPIDYFGSSLRGFYDGDVRYFNHPFWAYAVSKLMLSELSHEAVPETKVLTLDNASLVATGQYVLKPSEGYGGFGVNMRPKLRDALLHAANGYPWLLQKRVDAVPLLDTPVGGRYVEVRINYFGSTPVNSYARISDDGISNMSNTLKPWCGQAPVFISH